MDKLTAKAIASAVLAVLLGGGGLTGIYQKLSTVDDKISSMEKRMSTLCVALVMQNKISEKVMDCTK